MSGGEPGLHPGRLELVHYARGSLAAGHAAAVLAHCVTCNRCAARLLILMPERRPQDGGADRERLLAAVPGPRSA